MTERTVMTHVWCSRRFSPEQFGHACRVIAASRGKFLLEFQDGWRVATVRGTFKRLEPRYYQEPRP